MDSSITQPATMVVFGKGTVVVDTGHFYGVPAVFIATAKIGGDVGESAERENNPRDSLVEGEVVLTFPTIAQAKAVADALVTPESTT